MRERLDAHEVARAHTQHGRQRGVEESPEAGGRGGGQLMEHGAAPQSFMSRGTTSVIHGTNATSSRPSSRATTYGT